MGTGVKALDTEILKADTSSDDIDDRVQRTHLVEVHMFWRASVYTGLRFCQLLEDLQRGVSDPAIQIILLEQLPDLLQAPSVMVISVLGRADLEIGGDNPLATDLPGKKFERLFQAELPELILEMVQRQAHVQKRAKNHVPTGTVEWIKM